MNLVELGFEGKKVKNDGVIPAKKFISEMIEINKAAKLGNYSEAYHLLDELRQIIASGKYSEEDRLYVHNKLLQLLESQYRESILQLYNSKIELYKSQSDDGLELSRIIEGYPRVIGQTKSEYIEAYYRSKAISEINQETKKYRYGAYMHVIVDRVLNSDKYRNGDGSAQEKDNKGGKEPKVKPLSLAGLINDDRDER